MSIKDRIAFFNAVQGNANLKLEKNVTQPMLRGVGTGPGGSQDKAAHVTETPLSSRSWSKSPRESKSTHSKEPPKSHAKDEDAPACEAGSVESLLRDENLDISKFYIDRRKYKKEGVISRGAFGTVFVCEFVDTGEKMAMKKLRADFENPETRLLYEREIVIMGTIKHPAILSICGCTPYNEGFKDPLIIMPLMKNGSVNDMIKKEMSGDCPSEWTATRKHIVLYGTACGMAYMHKHRIMHRDLKPANILLDENLEPKIADFGLSKFVESGQTLQQSKVVAGTPVYMAPEIWDGIGKFGFEVDVYAFGMIMYAILSGSIPFNSIRNEWDLKQKICGAVRPPIPKSMPKEYCDIIEKCWDMNPDERPGFTDIVSALEDDAFRHCIDDQAFCEYQERMEGGDVTATVVEEESTVKDVIDDIFGDGRWLDISPFYVDVNEYQKTKSLGYGSYGKVWMCKSKKTGVIVAKKKLFWSDENKAETYYQREVGVMGRLRHPALLELVGCTPWSSGKPTILTRFMVNGSVDDMIKKEMSGDCPSEWTATRKHIVLYGTACGMAYMHKHRIMHRDLKPANILLDENLEPKIADFGFSKFVESGQTLQQTDSLGTPVYMAPEIWDGDCQFGFKADVYAFGMIMYSILTGSVPFAGCNRFTVGQKVCNGERPHLPPDIPGSYRSLITECWSRDPDLRPDFNEVVERLGESPTGQPDSDSFHAYQERLCSDRKIRTVTQDTCKSKGSAGSEKPQSHHEAPPQAEEAFEMTILPAKHKKTSSKHSSVKSLGESEKRDSIPASDWSDEAVECREEQKDTHQQGGLNVPGLDASTCIQKFEYHEGSPLNGIISYLTGTGVSMKNVHRKGVVEVTASSWAKSPYNAVEFWTDSVFSSKNEPNSWIRYDFKNRRVTPTSYSIGSYSGSYNPKSWVFEVSNDGSEGSWEVLDQRDNSSDLCEKNVTRNFPIISVPDRSFRFIRVRQTGVNNGHVPNDYLVIASLEVFGTLFQPTRPVSSPGIFAFDDLNPLMGIISHLNREFGGSLDQKGVVTVTASSHKASHEAYNALETITKPFFCFESKDKPNSWIRYDFKKRRVRPTGYSIHSGEDGCYLRTWVFEVSNNKSEWQVVDWQNNYGDLSDKFFIRHFTLTVPPLESFRFIRLRQTGKNSSDSDILTFTCLEIFGTLEQA